MKLRNSLWAFALVFAAVSCSDDFDDPNKGGENQNGETAKVNVLINTGAVTKANTKATAGEDGDNNELGDVKEYTVKDVTLILFKKAVEGEKEDDFTSVDDFEPECPLVAAGWTNEVGDMSSSDATTGTSTFPNGQMTTVTIAVKDKAETLFGHSYGVIAVTNLGKTAGEALVDKIGKTNMTTVDNLANELLADQTEGSGFVMSTHSLTGNVGSTVVNSIVEFPEAGSSVIPEVNVFVERLSAKVRIEPNGTPASFTYEVKNSENEKVAEVVLNSVAIVNQLTSNSYLLKRVSEDTTTDNIDLASLEATNDVLIGDEKVSATTAATNFVIDPWTRAKKEKDDDTGIEIPTDPTQLTYKNQWSKSTFGELWQTYSETDNDNTVALSTDNLTNGKQHLCYTQENTTSIAASLKGYNTGALFKATYYPTKWTTIDGTNNSVGEVNVQDADKKEAKTFYTYNDRIYENHLAILADILDNAIDGVEYSNFTSTNEVDKFKTAILQLEGHTDPFGYIDAMVAEANKEGTEPPVLQTPSDYIGTKGIYEPTDDDAIAAFNKKVRSYTNGVCYYEYWLRHADNGSPTLTGVMDLGIVRNNIYDMKVTAINNLGSSEVDPTDPLDPSEDGTLKIQVKLHVKNWVVRKNDNIIF